MTSAWGQSASYLHSKRVFNTSLNPLSLHVSARQPLTLTIIKGPRGLDHLRLGPRRHPIEQQLFERPHMIGQPRRHCWHTGAPQLGGAPALGRLGNWQGLA
jgi:hypothetical protein